jgi:hypothetical protein
MLVAMNASCARPVSRIRPLSRLCLRSRAATKRIRPLACLKIAVRLFLASLCLLKRLQRLRQMTHLSL